MAQMKCKERKREFMANSGKFSHAAKQIKHISINIIRGIEVMIMHISIIYNSKPIMAQSTIHDK